MDLNSVAQFIELVKNPKEFEAALKQLKDAQASIDASIATVGKVSEIDKIKEKAEKALLAAEKKLAAAETHATQSIAEIDNYRATTVRELAEKEVDITRVKQKADADLAKAEELFKEVVKRERQLRIDQDAYAIAATDLAKRSQEVEEKLAKLRTVMG